MKKSGYTLVEAMIVLMIVGIFLMMTSTTNLEKVKVQLNDRRAFEHIVQEINQAKDMSLTRQVPVQVIFNPGAQLIEISSETLGEPISMIPVPQDWQLLTGFSFTYMPNGRINRFQAVHFIHHLTQQRIRIVFQLGGGKFMMKA